MERELTTPVKKLLEEFDKLGPETKKRITRYFLDSGLTMMIVLPQVVGGTMVVLARKIAKKHGVNFDESYCVNPGEDPEGGEYIYSPRFYLECSNEREVETKATVLIRAEDELNEKCEKLADFIMELK